MLKDNCLLPMNQSPEALCCEINLCRLFSYHVKLAITIKYDAVHYSCNQNLRAY